MGPRRGAMHQGLVGARKLVGARYLTDPALRREYERDIAPRTVAALGKLLAQLYRPGTRPPARVLDLGAGTGAVGTALRARFGAGPDVVAVDRIAGPSIVVADLARGLPAVEGRFDLIVAAHLLNELFVDLPDVERIEARAARVRAWCRAFLADGGLALLVEPALRETSRDLLAVRDRLLASGLRVVAPCFWAGPCPALARERDWCHDAAAGPVPGAPRVDFSYLALREAGATAAGATAAATDPTLFRIVSDPLTEKGRLRIYGCGPAGRHALVRLDRHASAANAAFSDLARGDVARVAATEAAGDGLRLAPQSTVAIVDRDQVPAE